MISSARKKELEALVFAWSVEEISIDKNLRQRVEDLNAEWEGEFMDQNGLTYEELDTLKDMNYERMAREQESRSSASTTEGTAGAESMQGEDQG